MGDLARTREQRGRVSDSCDRRAQKVAASHEQEEAEGEEEEKDGRLQRHEHEQINARLASKLLLEPTFAPHLGENRHRGSSKPAPSMYSRLGRHLPWLTRGCVALASSLPAKRIFGFDSAP